MFRGAAAIIWRVLKWLLLVPAFYVAAVLVGLMPVNKGFRGADVDDASSVTIFVYSGSIHTDLILPVRTLTKDWRDEFPAEHLERDNVDRYSHVAIGWGDRGFCLHTPTWAELRYSTAINAMLISSSSVVHVDYCRKPTLGGGCQSVTISAAQYATLVEYVLSSLRESAPARSPIPGAAYYDTDAFYVANGSYHCFNTCNCWAADGLEKAGVTVPWFSPLPSTVLWYLHR